MWNPPNGAAGAAPCASKPRAHVGRLLVGARCVAALVLLLGSLAMMSACLITEVPEFPPPERTPPFLIASTASPALDAIHVIRDDKFEVSAEVRSEDVPNDSDPAEGRVVYKLLLDYGRPSGDRPYVQSVWTDRLDAATFEDRGRIATATWNGLNSGIAGCHTFTLVASHQFRDQEPSDCPLDLEDSSFLTWRVYVCSDTDCLPDQMPPSCPADVEPTKTCTCPSDPAFNSSTTRLCN